MPFIIMSEGGYYGGKTYIYQGETFPAFANKEEAKRYNSKKIADNVAARLERKCQGYFSVVEVEE